VSVRRREPKVRLVKWPTQDWYSTPVGYRLLKAAFGKPVGWAARIRSRGAQNVPMDGPVLLAVNHFTWADPVVLGVVLHRPAFYLAKEELFRNKPMGWFLETMGQIKVERVAGSNDDALATAVGLLSKGLVVGVFPEGTRSRGGELKRGKTGIARIAAKSGAPVVPVALATAGFWPKDSALPKLGRTVYINVGAPARYDLKPEDADDREKMRETTDDIMGRVKALLDEATEAQKRGEKW
jgi:1-acyl-sn-glycerol-3-phosphate acyltransferase